MIRTQFCTVNLGGLGNLLDVLSLYEKLKRCIVRYIHKITLGPASRRISATCMLVAVLMAVETWNLIILM